MGKRVNTKVLLAAAVLASWLGTSQKSDGQETFVARDPGLRESAPGVGGPLAGLTPDELRFFEAGLEEFEEVEGVGDGLGPRFNLDSCGGCHSQPTTGGTAPDVNPQVAAATAFGARNRVPSFLTLNGPVREARFKYRPDGARDGGVHPLFVISGRNDGTGDASGCSGVQEDFETQLGGGNVVFRIPTPLFGAGLIEQIPDRAILANQAASNLTKIFLGISGRPHRNGNDGTIARFGWKAQNKSLLLFSGEAYNVEMGITSDLFQTERDENPSCQLATHPNTGTPTAAAEEMPISAIEQFTFFMRFLAPPSPSLDRPGGSSSITRGRQLFVAIGCALCHTPTLRTGNSTVAALNDQPVNLYSDLLLHAMGPGLADDIIQGRAGPDEFRTAPLWGLGQRIFFLHDGRTTDLRVAIRAHRSAGNFRFGPSEANAVIDRFGGLSEYDKQHLLNFLRSL
jgi:CxxC motif-containing protein (DUF1111 family)